MHGFKDHNYKDNSLDVLTCIYEKHKTSTSPALQADMSLVPTLRWRTQSSEWLHKHVPRLSTYKLGMIQMKAALLNCQVLTPPIFSYRNLQWINYSFEPLEDILSSC